MLEPGAAAFHNAHFWTQLSPISLRRSLLCTTTPSCVAGRPHSLCHAAGARKAQTQAESCRNECVANAIYYYVLYSRLCGLRRVEYTALIAPIVGSTILLVPLRGAQYSNDLFGKWQANSCIAAAAAATAAVTATVGEEETALSGTQRRAGLLGFCKNSSLDSRAPCSGCQPPGRLPDSLGNSVEVMAVRNASCLKPYAFIPLLACRLACSSTHSVTRFR